MCVDNTFALNQDPFGASLCVPSYHFRTGHTSSRFPLLQGERTGEGIRCPRERPDCFSQLDLSRGTQQIHVRIRLRPRWRDRKIIYVGWEDSGGYVQLVLSIPRFCDPPCVALTWNPSVSDIWGTKMTKKQTANLRVL